VIGSRLGSARGFTGTIASRSNAQRKCSIIDAIPHGINEGKVFVEFSRGICRHAKPLKAIGPEPNTPVIPDGGTTEIRMRGSGPVFHTRKLVE